MTAVEVRGLTRTYPGKPPVPALKGLDLDIPSGRITAVLGPSGCGKTTLLRIVAGFDRPDAGTVRFDQDLVSGPGASVPPERRRVSIVPQEGALFPHLDVAGNVAFGLPRNRPDRDARVAEVLELVGLAGMGARRPHELSGGQQQRVALARALAPDPAIVLLDEPFSALDAGLREGLRQEVSDTLAASGTTAMLVTHDQGEAMSMADHLAVMRDGRIVQAGPPGDVYHRPVDVDVARFLGEAVLLPARLHDGELTCALGPITPAGGSNGATTPTGPRTVCLRPEQVGRDDSSPRRATVVAVHYLGHDALVDLAVDGESVRARWSSVHLPHVGDDVGITVLGEAVTFPST